MFKKLFKGKRAVGAIGAVFLFIVFIVMWFIWLGKWISTVGQLAVTTNSLTGVEAFFFMNLNFVVFICMLLGMLGFMYFGASNG